MIRIASFPGPAQLFVACACSTEECFTVLIAMESWAGPGNEASDTCVHLLTNSCFNFVKLQVEREIQMYTCELITAIIETETSTWVGGWVADVRVHAL